MKPINLDPLCVGRVYTGQEEKWEVGEGEWMLAGQKTNCVFYGSAPPLTDGDLSLREISSSQVPQDLVSVGVNLVLTFGQAISSQPFAYGLEQLEPGTKNLILRENFSF